MNIEENSSHKDEVEPHKKEIPSENKLDGSANPQDPSFLTENEKSVDVYNRLEWSDLITKGFLNIVNQMTKVVSFL